MAWLPVSDSGVGEMCVRECSVDAVLQDDRERNQWLRAVQLEARLVSRLA